MRPWVSGGTLNIIWVAMWRPAGTGLARMTPGEPRAVNSPPLTSPPPSKRLRQAYFPFSPARRKASANAPPPASARPPFGAALIFFCGTWPFGAPACGLPSTPG